MVRLRAPPLTRINLNQNITEYSNNSDFQEGLPFLEIPHYSLQAVCCRLRGPLSSDAGGGVFHPEPTKKTTPHPTLQPGVATRCLCPVRSQKHSHKRPHHFVDPYFFY